LNSATFSRESQPNNVEAAAREYESAGWKLAPIEQGQKRPRIKGWQREESAGPVPAGWRGGIGLLHAWSGTVCIDIDRLADATEALVWEGVNLQGLLDAPDAVQIVSGRPDRAKLLYRLPAGYEPLLRVQMDGAIDFRCASRRGTTFQDVVPPSRHPSGAPYRWGGAGDWRNLPELPQELLDLWLRLIEERGSADAGGGESDSEPRSVDFDPVDALSYCDPSCVYDLWIELGMAFHAAGGEFADFDEWSSRGDNYRDTEDARTHWESFTARGGVGVGTLWHHAREAGWQPPERPRPTVEEMFGDVPDSETPDPAQSVPTEAALRREVDALTPGATIDALLRRIVCIDAIRGSDTTARRWSDDVAERIRSPKAAVWADMQRMRRQYRNIHAQNTRQNGASDLLQAAMTKLSPDASPEPLTAAEIESRYIFVLSGAYEGRFYDRITRGFMKPTTFNAAYSHITAGAGPDGSAVQPVTYFSNRCVRAHAVKFRPGHPHMVFQDRRGELVLNTWEFEGVPPKPGDPSPWLMHLEWLLPDKAQRQHLLQWFAWTIRHQERKCNHQIIIGGKSRIGKDMLLRPITEALGARYVYSVEPQMLAEPYTDWAYGRKLAVLNELQNTGLGHKHLENRLKPFAAAPPDEIPIRVFGQSSGDLQPNVIHLIATTNDRGAFNFSDSRERWFALWCAPTECKPAGYYQGFGKWLDNTDNIAAVIHYLHQIDLSDFDAYGHAPETPWQIQLQHQGEAADEVYDLLTEMVDSRIAPFDKPVFRFRDLMDAVNLQAMSNPELRKRAKQPTIVRCLYQLGCVFSGKRNVRINGKHTRVQVWATPDHADAMRGATPAQWHEAIARGDQ
jgi:hypothetical protein